MAAFALIAPATAAQAARGPDAAAGGERQAAGGRRQAAGGRRQAVLVNVDGFKNRIGRVPVPLYGNIPSSSSPRARS